MLNALFENLNPAVYRYTDNAKLKLSSAKKQIGIIAQDIRKGISQSGENPDEYSIVEKRNGDEFYSVEYTQLIPVLISKIKELEKRIEFLESKWYHSKKGAINANRKDTSRNL